ncbi:hypothetical protein [Peribacillus butanolivorans]|uniref:hypothetical protein n=1 Tax=Peribacillus butanolivorans TaxID=421767 RepID=UPI0036735261
MEYYSNPNKVSVNDLILHKTKIGDYQVFESDSKLSIEGNGEPIEIDLPEHSHLKSLHLSHDERYLAFDSQVQERVEIFVVNLQTGESSNISDSYDYAGYEQPYGIAWSPAKNIMALIGGYPDSARIVLFDMDSGEEGHGGSEIFKDIYGVKWNRDGESIHYLVDSFDGDGDYTEYQTEIQSDHELLGGTINKIKALNQEEYEEWFID